METEKDKIEKIYSTPSKPGAFLGPDKIYKVLKSTGFHQPGLHKIRNVLQNKDDYSLQRPVRRKFKRAKVVVSNLMEEFDADLADMQSLADDNDGVKYLLVAIDDFSRFLYVQPLKNKTGNEVLNGLKKIFTSGKPKKLRTDNGSEFKYRKLKIYLSNQNIYHHITMNDVKASLVERVILTLKRMIFRYLLLKRKFTYIDVLQDLVKSYNATPHSSLNNTPPKDVNEHNSSDLFAYQYMKRHIKNKSSLLKKKRKTKKGFKYKLGQLVRISHLKGAFTRSYNEQWSYEVYKIYRRFFLEGIPMYKLKDLALELISGNFYQAELLPVNKNEETLWHIEKILKRRVKNKKRQVLVKWVGYPHKFNSWIDESEVKNI